MNSSKKQKGSYFFSDLDGTLLYTNKEGGEDVRIVETHKAGTHGYMESRVIALIEKMQEADRFIPVTTRSIEQVMRIDVVNKSNCIVCSNGGTILIDGQEDLMYKTFLDDCMIEKGIDFSKIIERVKQTMVEQMAFLRVVDERFVYLKLQNEERVEDSKRLLEDMKIAHCSIFQVKSKLYIIPDFISKATAISYLKTRLNIDFVVCAGDTKMDVPMLKESHLSIAPYHRTFDFKPTIVTPTTGIRAGWEIVKEVMGVMDI